MDIRARTQRFPFSRAAISARLIIFAAVICAFTGSAFAQENYVKPVPVFSGAMGFITTVDGGHAELAPAFVPVMLIPLGDRWLIESRAEFTGDFQRRNGSFYGGGGTSDETSNIVNFTIN